MRFLDSYSPPICINCYGLNTINIVGVSECVYCGNYLQSYQSWLFRVSVLVRRWLIRIRLLNGKFQYNIHRTATVSEGWKWVVPGHPSKFLRYFSWRTGIPPKLSVPWQQANGENAAQLAVHAQILYSHFRPEHGILHHQKRRPTNERRSPLLIKL